MVTDQPPLLQLGPDDAAPERLRFLWATAGKMPTGHVCGDCRHYANRMCLMVGPTLADWRKDFTGCGWWEYAP